MVGGGLFTIFGASKPQPVAPDPFDDLDDIDKVPADPRTASQLEALVEKTRDEVLAYHFAGRPANTMKNYAPKQREWSVCYVPAIPATRLADAECPSRRGVPGMPGQKAASTCPVSWLMRASSSSSLGRRSPLVRHDEDDASLQRSGEGPK